jgi:alpha-galactosidase
MHIMNILALLLAAGVAASVFAKKDHISNGLAKTPPMGWSSWNMFGDQINETLIRETIDVMASSGLQEAGFQYVNLDDGWQRYKGPRGDLPLEPDPAKFPSGMKALADYAHSKGFKLGIYTGPGNITCAGYTASGGHEKEDAALFASWGIDHLKYDSCCEYETATTPVVQEVVLKMSKALLATKRPIVYHACHCGWNNIWEWFVNILCFDSSQLSICCLLLLETI